MHSFFGKSKSTLLAVNNLQRDSTLRYTHISSVNKANPEKTWTTIWIFWISMVHIKAYFPTIRPSNNKKTAKSTFLSPDRGSFTKLINQLPTFPKANQILWHCFNSQSVLLPNLAITSTNVREFVSGLILAVAVRENVWEPLKLALTKVRDSGLRISVPLPWIEVSLQQR